MSKKYSKYPQASYSDLGKFVLQPVLMLVVWMAGVLAGRVHGVRAVPEDLVVLTTKIFTGL